MTRRRAVKILSLVLALILVFGFAQMYFWRCNSHNELRLYGFRMEQKDSLDVVLLGASDIYAYSAPLAYSLQGFTSYPYVVSACSVCFWKVMLEDILAHQNPKLIVVETTGACYDTQRELHNNGALHYIMDSMPFLLKLQMIRPLLTEENDSAAAFLFPGLKYHSNWNDPEDLKSNFLNVRMLQRQGHAILRGTYTSRYAIGLQSESRNIENDRAEQPLDAEAEQALREFLDFCREKDVPVLFTCFPHQITTEDDEVYQNFKMTNTIWKIVDEYGFPFLNMETLSDEIGIDRSMTTITEHTSISTDSRNSRSIWRVTFEKSSALSRGNRMRNKRGPGKNRQTTIPATADTLKKLPQTRRHCSQRLMIL